MLWRTQVSSTRELGISKKPRLTIPRYVSIYSSFYLGSENQREGALHLDETRLHRVRGLQGADPRQVLLPSSHSNLHDLRSTIISHQHYSAEACRDILYRIWLPRLRATIRCNNTASTTHCKQWSADNLCKPSQVILYVPQERENSLWNLSREGKRTWPEEQTRRPWDNNQTFEEGLVQRRCCCPVEPWWRVFQTTQKLIRPIAVHLGRGSSPDRQYESEERFGNYWWPITLAGDYLWKTFIKW